LSALKHGFFRRGFMLCDRCVLATRCKSFVPGGECAIERKAYDWAVSELMAQYGLEGLADEILVGRVAMNIIRIARAEAYEANVGVSEASIAWGRYISGLDNTLRALLKDLVLTRAERKKFGEEKVLTPEELLKQFSGVKKTERIIQARTYSPRDLLIKDWNAFRRRHKSIAKIVRSEREKRIT